jgi:hypothetical protein
MSDLDEIYTRLARNWQQEELAARYPTAKGGDARSRRRRRDDDRALPMVASALPAIATLGVAVYVLHLLRAGAQGDLARLMGFASARVDADKAESRSRIVWTRIRRSGCFPRCRWRSKAPHW